MRDVEGFDPRRLARQLEELGEVEPCQRAALLHLNQLRLSLRVGYGELDGLLVVPGVLASCLEGAENDRLLGLRLQHLPHRLAVRQRNLQAT
eukprot:656296-Hanusia_phi.AAC.3